MTKERVRKKWTPALHQAVSSLAAGILGFICLQFVPELAIVLGIIGINCAMLAKKLGETGNIRLSGLVMSIFSLVLGIMSLLFVALAVVLYYLLL